MMSNSQECTMQSSELLALVNQARESYGERAVRRNDFISRCEDELEGEHYETFVVKNPNQTESRDLRLNLDQCLWVLMRESKAVRRSVTTRLNELRNQQRHIPQSLPEALRLAADLAEQNNSLRLVVKEQEPKVQALERIADAKGTLCMTDAAKHIGMQPKALIDWLRENRWIYRRTGSTRWIAFEPRLSQGLLWHKTSVIGVGDDGEQRVASQVRVTPRGLVVLAQKLGGRN
ncbi:DNA-binding protein [Pseudomonas neustonica]|uniref:DNA-binding protein n=2 Tax=Pseudomonas TaxID=286 RepID=A0ABX9XNE6_9PSED|nr:DNA-binding protein [Pseudomonas sp. SSM44]ROZ88568.1 DNA-binding protein [Pseudomonas neustonica]